MQNERKVLGMLGLLSMTAGATEVAAKKEPAKKAVTVAKARSREGGSRGEGREEGGEEDRGRRRQRTRLMRGRRWRR